MQMLTDSPRISLGTLLTITVLILTGFLLNFYHLDRTEFFGHQPAQVAADARYMNEHGQWLVPVIDGQVRTGVSPLYLWLTKLSFWIGGDADPLHTRIPSAVCSLLLMLLVAYWMRQQADRYGREDQTETPAEGFGLMAALVLAANPVLIEVGRDGTPSSLFTLLYAAAAYCWAESLEARRSYYAGRHWSSWLRWGYVLAGITLLVKGPLVLLLLWLPYYFAARSYRLSRINPEHLKGTLIALALGCWWPLAVGLQHPEAAGRVWSDWLSFDLIEFDTFQTGIPGYFGRLALYTLPWLAPAILMIVRVHRRQDRSPTLVFWSWALIATAPALALMGGEPDWRLLPLAPWIALLATDGFHRWNFESQGSAHYRAILRVWLVLAILAGLFFAALLNSDSWLGLFLLLPLAWGYWAMRNSRNEIVYTPWETTVCLASMAAVVLVMGYLLLLNEYEPRRNFQHTSTSWFEQVEGRLEQSPLPVYFMGPTLPGLYAYYLPQRPQLAVELAQVRSRAPHGAVLLAERSSTLRELLAAPDCWPLALRPGKDPRQPQAGLFLYQPGQTQTSQTVTVTPDVTAVSTATLTTVTLTTTTLRATAPTSGSLPAELLPYPFHLAVLGNTGRRSPELHNVARRLRRAQASLGIDHALLLGNNLWGPSLWNHLDTQESFESPFRRVLEGGMMFHAALGHEDQAYAWLQTSYQPFHMFGQRYYRREFAGGLVEIFMLDSSALRRGDNAQLKWLQEALANSRAPWRVVGLQLALASDSYDGRADETLAKSLLPIVQAGRVNLVLWSGGLWYERLRLADQQAVFVNAGWSGDANRTRFRNNPELQMATDRAPGFVLLSFTPDALTYRAITEKGQVIDQFDLQRGQGAEAARNVLDTLHPAGNGGSAAVAASNMGAHQENDRRKPAERGAKGKDGKDGGRHDRKHGGKAKAEPAAAATSTESPTPAESPLPATGARSLTGTVPATTSTATVVTTDTLSAPFVDEAPFTTDTHRIELQDGDAQTTGHRRIRPDDED